MGQSKRKTTAAATTTKAYTMLQATLFRASAPRGVGRLQRRSSRPVSSSSSFSSVSRPRPLVLNKRQATRKTTKMGLPIVGWIINPVTIFFAYALGAARFASGFARTSYQNNLGTKVVLAALWPALYAVNQTFRKNFKKSVGL